jgi:DNA-binding MltR family transcriptional regulator
MFSYWIGSNMKDKFFLDLNDRENLKARITLLGEAIDAEAPLPLALLCGAYVDRCLQHILEQYLIKSDTAKDMLKPTRPLGSTAMRSRLVYCLGLIDSNTKDLIERIADVRNVFAHSAEPIDWESAPVRDIVAKLPLLAPMPSTEAALALAQRSSGHIFLMSSILALSALMAVADTMSQIETPRDRQERAKQLQSPVQNPPSPPPV